MRAFSEAGMEIGGGVSAGHTGGTVEMVAAAIAKRGYMRLLHVIEQLVGALLDVSKEG